MRFILIPFLFLVLPVFAFAQQLSRSETISYINKRIAHTTLYNLYYSDQLTYIISSTQLKLSPANKGKISLSYYRRYSNGQSDLLEYIFDPIQIARVTTNPDVSDNPVGMVAARMVDKTILLKLTVNGNVQESNVDYILVPYLRTNPLNAERITKALMHLKKTSEALKPLDPFVN